MTDPCENIGEIDFDNEDHLRKILLRDKHTRIEGLFTEVFFYEEILSETFTDYTTGWWFTVKEGTYRITKLCFSVQELSELDIELLEWFSNVNSNVFIVEFSEKQKSFFYGKYQNGLKTDFKTKWSGIRKIYPRNSNQAALPRESERNESRSNQAINYLKQRHLLKKYAVERMFANCWLGNAYYWDIDYLVKFRGRFIAFEVKQKFPTAKNTWGLNTGLVKLFTYLDSIGILVIHFILKKPVNDASIPAIDLYMKEQYRKDAKWIATRFPEASIQRAGTLAPSYTSIHGNASLSYYHLQQNDFLMIKKVGASDNKLTDFLLSKISGVA
jgi:hypothetical protein